jgi:predicted PurR-regulated permease PerM
MVAATPRTDQRSWLAWVLRLLFLAAAIAVTYDLLAPAGMGAVLATPLWPIHQRLQRKIAPSLSAALITLVTVTVVVLPTVVIIESLLEQAASVRSHLQELDQVEGDLVHRLSEPARSIGLGRAQVADAIAGLLERLRAGLGELLAGIAAKAPDQLIGLFVLIAALYYLLRDGVRLLDVLRKASPFSPAANEALSNRLRITVRRALLATFIAGLAQASLLYLGMLILEVPAATLWAATAVILSFVPLIGTAPISAGASLYLLLTGRPVAMVVMIGLGLLAGVVDNLIIARVQGGEALHPLIALIAVFGGLSLFGAWGIFFGPVIAQLGVWAVRERGAPA